MTRPSNRPRREPRFTMFIATGAVLGVAMGGFAALVTPDSGLYSATSAVGYVSVFAGLVGGLAGALVAVLIAGRR